MVAGPPDVVDPDDPWAALEGRSGARLHVVSTADGKRLSEIKLDNPPVFDGMAVANGMVVLATVGSEVVCLDAE